VSCAVANVPTRGDRVPSVRRSSGARLCAALARRTRCAGESGFTLIELTIVLVILPLIIGAVTIVMITTLKATSDSNGTNSRLAQFHDSQITATYFDRDVQNATAVTTQVTSTPLCGTGTQVLGLATDGGSSEVSYVTGMGGSPAVPELLRNYCGSGSSASTSTIAHTLQAAIPPSVTTTLVCNPPNDPTCNSEAPASLLTTLDVTTVEMDVTLESRDSLGPIASSINTIRLTASPRQSLGSGSTSAIVASTPPLLLLGSGAQCGGANSLTVNGVLGVDSNQPGSIKPGHSMEAQQVYSPPISGGGSPVNGSFTQPPGTPPGTPKFATGGVIADPYQFLPVPNPNAPNTYVYQNPLTTGNDGGSKLKSGIYILENGISGSFTSEAGGVYFYVTGGTITLQGNPNLNLTAMTSGPYAGVLLYQVPSDTNNIHLQGTPDATALNGVIDASGASLDLGGNASIITLGLVAQGIVGCTGSTSAYFGPQMTTTTLTSSSNPSIAGQQVTFTANVTITSAQNVAPVGNVNFSITSSSAGPVTCNGGTNQVPLINGVAQCATSALTHAGSPYAVTATYPSSFGIQGSSATVSQGVLAASSVLVSSSPNPPLSQEAVTIKANVSGSGVPQGTVTFTITPNKGKGVNCTGVANNTVALSGGSASCAVPGGLDAGNAPYSVTAQYSGDANNAPSTGSLSPLTVTQTVHLSSLTAAGSKPSGGNWQATVNIAVQDSDGNSIVGVVVTGAWSTATSPNGCTTGANGMCSFIAGPISSNTMETWTVTNLSLAGYAYDSSKNVNGGSVNVKHS
jgi:prepilin-type N-terminal cleavage/methylation domain-containing protein